jgi:glycosyltransferase involved in cell wall biosynthesis
MVIHYIVPAFAPEESGFAIAFKNFCFSIIERDDIEKIIVYSPEKLEMVLHPKIETVHSKKLVKSSFFIRNFSNIIGYLLAKVYLLTWLKSFKSINIESNDIIFVESLYLAHISLMLEKMYPKTQVVTRIHGSFPEVAFWNRDRYRLYVMGLIYKTRNIAVTTYHYIDYLNTKFKPSVDNKRRYYIVPNTLPKASLIKNKTAIGITKLLQLGRMGEFGYFQKGFQDVIQALFYLEETQNIETLESIEYTVIGSGPFMEEFLGKTKKIKHIKIRHYSSLPNIEVQKEVDYSSLILIPSRFEGMSMFATEVLAKGKPFIFTSDGGMMDMIKDGVNGVSVRPFDYIAIAEAILSFKHNPNKINEFSNNSIELFNKEFSYENVNRKFGVLLKDLC